MLQDGSPHLVASATAPSVDHWAAADMYLAYMSKILVDQVAEWFHCAGSDTSPGAPADAVAV